MPMKNPPHPGMHIRSCMDELGLSVSKTSRELGISRQQLHNILSGRSGINAQTAVRLERAFGSTAESWLALQAAYELAAARRTVDLSQVPAYVS